jgi:putative copper resistance protein D
MRNCVRRSGVVVNGRGAHRETPRLGPRLLAPVVAVAALPLTSSGVHAHGQAPIEPTPAILLEGWTFLVDVWLPVILMALVYWQARNMVNQRHPANPVPRWRLWSWLAGLGAIILALASPIEFYDTTLFSVHMIQHLLLSFVAAPLLVLAAPITLLLRVASPHARRRWILPLLESRPVRLISHPLVAWCLFAGVMYFAHFSPLFDAALDDFTLHRLEHALFLGTALLFWWPVIGADPSPHRLGYGARILYLALGMPLSSFLGLVIFSAPTVLYDHYATLARDWGPTPLLDQQWAGGIMWAGGDAAFVVALLLTVAAWMRHEERAALREDARLARSRTRAGAATATTAASATNTAAAATVASATSTAAATTAASATNTALAAAGSAALAPPGEVRTGSATLGRSE